MSDKPSLSSLSNARQGANNSLSLLKQKMQKPSSLASLASNAPKPLSSLQSLATRAPVQKTPAVRTTASPKLGSLSSLASRPPIKLAKPTVIKHAPIEAKPSPPVEQVTNPLVAKPSLAAQFLFRPQPSPSLQPPPEKSRHVSIHVFQFDQPSPDDIVMAAQSQRPNNTKKN